MITIKLSNGQELSVEEARALWVELGKIFGEKVRHVPPPPTVYGPITGQKYLVDRLRTATCQKG